MHSTRRGYSHDFSLIFLLIHEERKISFVDVCAVCVCRIVQLACNRVGHWPQLLCPFVNIPLANELKHLTHSTHTNSSCFEDTKSNIYTRDAGWLPSILLFGVCVCSRTTNMCSQWIKINVNNSINLNECRNEFETESRNNKHILFLRPRAGRSSNKRHHYELKFITQMSYVVCRMPDAVYVSIKSEFLLCSDGELSSHRFMVRSLYFTPLRCLSSARSISRLACALFHMTHDDRICYLFEREKQQSNEEKNFNRVLNFHLFMK